MNDTRDESSRHTPAGQDLVPRAMTPREKTKRPQLSCNSCRLRKVKCDRVQPCTACSLHQIADQCVYDLSDSERQPILQAEALREKDKEIDSLRRQLLELADPAGHLELMGEHSEWTKKRKTTASASNFRQTTSCMINGNAGSHCQEGVTAATMQTSLQKQPDLAVEVQTPPFLSSSHPFPSLWTAEHGVSGLLMVLPHREDLLRHAASFTSLIVPFDFPHQPQFFSAASLEAFCQHPHEIARQEPARLALIFAASAVCRLHDPTTGPASAQDCTPKADHNGSASADIQVAAAMQALRLAAYLRRPTVTVVETLLLLGLYLAKSGRYLESWNLFGSTARLAQAIDLHRNPLRLRCSWSPEILKIRASLWSWILQVDQQFTVILGRPPAIIVVEEAALGPISEDSSDASVVFARVRSRTLYQAQQMLLARTRAPEQLDRCVPKLLSSIAALDPELRFDVSWLSSMQLQKHRPLDAQAALLHQHIHGVILYKYHDRLHDPASVAAANQTSRSTSPETTNGNVRGMLQSCREIIYSVEYLRLRSRLGVMSWATCQQAFNAACILIDHGALRPESEDGQLVRQVWAIFRSLQQRGDPPLAELAADLQSKMLAQVSQPPAPADHGDLRADICAHRLPAREENGLQGHSSLDVLHFVDVDAPQMSRCDSNRPDRSKRPRPDTETHAPVQKRLRKQEDKRHLLRQDDLHNVQVEGWPMALTQVTGNRSRTVEGTNATASSSDYIYEAPQGTPTTLQFSPAAFENMQRTFQMSDHFGRPVSESETEATVQASMWAHAGVSWEQEPSSLHRRFASEHLRSLTHASATHMPSTSTPPALSGPSCRSSTYAHSTDSSLHTPSGSHPASPALDHEQAFAIAAHAHLTQRALELPEQSSLGSPPAGRTDQSSAIASSEEHSPLHKSGAPVMFCLDDHGPMTAPYTMHRTLTQQDLQHAVAFTGSIAMTEPNSRWIESDMQFTNVA